MAVELTHDDLVNRCYFGDCRETLAWLHEEGIRVQMCVCSPPFWGLRAERDSEGKPIRKQIGVEPTPAKYAENLVEVFNLVREILADDGTLWLNLGDSYIGSGVNKGDKNPGLNKDAKRGRIERRPGTRKLAKLRLKNKDLAGIPWTVAFALRNAGWWLRSEIIWAKGISGQAELEDMILEACVAHGVSMSTALDICESIGLYHGSCKPEPHKDRPVYSHEQIFLLPKSADYYCDEKALTEPMAPGSLNRYLRAVTENETFDPSRHKSVPDQQPPMELLTRAAKGVVERGAYRRRRSVWAIPPGSHRGSHSAAYPPELIEPCILAGSRPGDIVLDPFMGSGTTAQVCEELGRRWIGCEINLTYRDEQQQRLRQRSLLAEMG